MRQLRTEGSTTEEWDWADVMAHLGCDEKTAKAIMKECRQQLNRSDYGPIEKHLLLDFINQKQREEREREARHQADLANADMAATLKVQVSTLKEQVDTLNKMCRQSAVETERAKNAARISQVIAALSLIVSVIAILCEACLSIIH